MPIFPSLNITFGKIPIFAFPGEAIPGQFGPMMRAFFYAA